jgi:lysophospholipase L1-like esterase
VFFPSFVLALVLLAVPAEAQVRVLCYGDSITRGADADDPRRSYPGELQRLRPDLEVLNEGRAGDASGNLERFRAALAESQPDVVVLLLGTDDAVCAPGAVPACDASPVPARSAEHVLTMAADAYNMGAKVFVLTPPPAVCKGDCDAQNDVAHATWMRDAFTDRLADDLRRARTPRGMRIADLRRKLSDAAWATLSTDGVHPSAEGNRMIARFVSAYIGRYPRARMAAGRAPAATANERATSADAATPRARSAAKARPPAAARREARRTDERSPFARKPQDRRYLR